MHFSPNKCNPLLTKFWKRYKFNNEDNKVSSLIYGVRFDL